MSQATPFASACGGHWGKSTTVWLANHTRVAPPGRAILPAVVATVSAVQSPRALGALVLVVAMACGGAAAGLVRRAAALPEPDMPPGRRVPARAVGVSSSPCQTRPRGMSCYRPVVRYTMEGVSVDVVSRDAYTPNPYPEGTQVDVALLPDGAAWLAPEWDGRIEAAREVVRQSRRRRGTSALPCSSPRRQAWC